MKLIRLLLQSSWAVISLSIVTGLMTGATSAGLIALINISINRSNIPRTTLAWGFVGLCLLLLLFSTVSQILVGRVVQKVIYDLRSRLSRRILSSPLRRLEDLGAPRLLSALTEDVSAISVASFSVSTLLVNVSLLLGCLAYLSWLVPSFSFFGSLFMLFGFWSYNTLAQRAWRSIRFAREQQDALFQHFQTITQGTKELKLHHQRRQAFLQEDLLTAVAKSRRYQVSSNDWFAIAANWGLLLFFIPIGIFLFVPTVIGLIPPQVVASYALTIIFMIAPLRAILSVLPDLKRANIALQKIDSLGLSVQTLPPEMPLLPPARSTADWQTLRFTGVMHSYPSERDDRQFTVGPLHLTFYPGELVFIVGGNGSGKSTFVKLVTGLYIPEAGQIEFDGHPITDVDREWYRQQFSVVFADYYLFDRLLGLETAHLDQQTQEYLMQLQLDHKVTIKDGRFSTTALSQGQRKRLALLTTYLEDRPIYVFDEWASDQDPVFKAIFYQELLPKLKQKGKTVLVVSHDDRYFQVADRLIKLEYGQVVDVVSVANENGKVRTI